MICNYFDNWLFICMIDICIVYDDLLLAFYPWTICFVMWKPNSLFNSILTKHSTYVKWN